MQSIETDDILFEILNASADLKAALSGGIFVQGERPDNSGKEDVVINNLFLNHEVPQTGTSNVNIHVPDKKERMMVVVAVRPAFAFSCAPRSRER